MLILYIIQKIATASLFIVQMAMLARAVMSWFPSLADGAAGDFVYMFTEPFIIPVRSVLERIEWINNSFLDIPFFVTFLILATVYDIIA